MSYGELAGARDNLGLCSTKVVIKQTGSDPTYINSPFTLVNEDGEIAGRGKFNGGLGTCFTTDIGTMTIYCDGVKTSHKVTIPAAYGTVKKKVRSLRTQIYGIKVAKNDPDPTTRVTYTDDAVGMRPFKMDLASHTPDFGDWDETFIIEKNIPIMQNPDGSVKCKLNPDNYAVDIEGNPSGISDAGQTANAMVTIPRVYVKRWEDADFEYTQFSEDQIDASFKAYAHQRADGTIAEYFTKSIYEGSVQSNKLRSLSGKTPTNTLSGETQMSYAEANGAKWMVDTWSRIALIWDLLILMGCSTDVEETFGYGITSGMSQASHIRATGQGDTYGMWYGGTEANNCIVKAFGIEHLWGHLWKLCHGMYYSTSQGYKVKMTPPYNRNGDGYTVIGKTCGGTSGGYQSKHFNSDYGRIPIEASGSASTYIPDGLWWADGCPLRVGGAGYAGLHCGLAVAVNNALSHSVWDYSAALSCEMPDDALAA